MWNNAQRINSVDRLMKNINGISRWNVDRQDCDNVLRIEATKVSPRAVENVLKKAGYYWEELND